MSPPPTFDETYRRCEFSGLVRMGMLVGGWLLRMLRLAKAGRINRSRRALSATLADIVPR
jgi:hypothetical protein